ncbi:hypothetical protein ACFL04_04180 [Patescibacteria group bacterium]
MDYKKYSHNIRNTVSLPFIWVTIIPLLVIDLLTEIYHRVCFPLYGLPRVKRGTYIRIDRHKLKYLNLVDKLGCVYCGYANGWLLYAADIAGKTEQYWCGIRHREHGDYKAPEHHQNFVDYGNEQQFKERYSK